MLHTFNATFLTLIPNSEGDDTPSKFQPIVLCNVIGKIITKAIDNRIKPILPILVAPEQYGFVEGHQIINWVIIVHEVIHT